MESKFTFLFRSWRLPRFSTTNRQWQRCTPWMWVSGFEWRHPWWTL